jgi:cellulose synthase/poly-beta-1,6-N-acetylglucosamine synthase-like glycosyltransferase
MPQNTDPFQDTGPLQSNLSRFKPTQFSMSQRNLSPLEVRRFEPIQMQADDIEDLKHFIVGPLVTQTLFDLALTKAVQTGVPLDSLLIQEGLMDEEGYVKQLSQVIGLDYMSARHATKLQLQFHDSNKVNRRFGWSYYKTDDGFAIVPFGTGAMGPKKIRAVIQKFIEENQISLSTTSPVKIYLVSRTIVRNAFQARFSYDLLFYAKEGLAHKSPEQSAKGGLSGLQTIGLLSLIGLCLYGFWVSSHFTIHALSVCFSLFFFCLIFFRLITALKFQSIAKQFMPSRHPLPRNHPQLPIYTLLVPLFRETAVLPQLISALEELDYPKAKLDIKLLLEEIDTSTIEAVKAMNLPPYFHVLIVPDGHPRTKPKALNYGLQLAQGDYLVIYDAEDIPEPSQLRRALEAFENSSSNCAVIQAKLNFYNQKQNWLTKQFTMEYSSLFDGLLPAYFKFSVPLPLGGTSNHFRTDVLNAVGGWDPYNVTEDADLGMRLYRCGYRATILGSTTYEEACSQFSSWLYQRTRWLKGWMQTYYVHMRQPFTLWQDLGTWKFFGFQLAVGAPIFSALVHPIFLGLLLWTISFSDLANIYEVWSSTWPTIWPLWGLALFNLTVGYFATMWLGSQALRFRRTAGFIFTIFTLPFYWLLISFATYRALFQLIHAPFYWEKTDHKGKVSE